jgi:DNA-binding response OmpR family regulator
MSRHIRKLGTVTKPSERTRVIVVDDEEDITRLLKVAFEQAGMVVTAFNDPATALENFMPGKYDLAILDVRMPGMTGFELYRSIREMDGGRTKVCFLTAFELYDEDLAKNEVGKSEVSCFIKKPIKVADLIKRVKIVLEG